MIRRNELKRWSPLWLQGQYRILGEQTTVSPGFTTTPAANVICKNNYAVGLPILLKIIKRGRNLTSNVFCNVLYVNTNLLKVSGQKGCEMPYVRHKYKQMWYHEDQGSAAFYVGCAGDYTQNPFRQKWPQSSNSDKLKWQWMF